MCSSKAADRLVGLVVTASTSGAADPGFDSRFLRGDFSESSHTSDTSDIKTGTPVATLLGVRYCRVSAGQVGPVLVCYDWVR